MFNVNNLVNGGCMRNKDELKLLIWIANEAFEKTLGEYDCQIIRDLYRDLDDGNYIKLLCDLRFRHISKDSFLRSR